MTKQFLTVITLFMLTVSAFASERIINIDLYGNTAELEMSDRDLMIWNLAIVNADKRIKIIEDDNCSEGSCTQRIVLEKEKVVQLTLQYDPGPFEEGYEYLEFNFPLSSLKPEDLATLQSLSAGFWDLLGKKHAAKKRLAKNIFNLDLKTVRKIVDTIDYQNSTLCDFGDTWCREDIRYVKKEIKVQELTVNLK